MVTYVRMPKLTWTMEEGSVGKWYKTVGDEVTKGEPICEVETEKSVDELVAPESGTLRKIAVSSGEIAKVNQVIAIIAGPDETLPEAEPEQIPIEQPTPKHETVQEMPKIEETEISRPEEKIKASPIARKLAQEHGINLEKIKGTGPDGRIIREDVLRAIEKPEGAEMIPLTQMRKVIAKRLSISARTALHVPLTIEVDMTEAIRLMEISCAEMEKTYAVHITPTILLVRAVSKALEKHPIINSRLKGDQVEVPEDINVGVATAMEDGLVVPVIRNANKKSLVEIARTSSALAEKARKETLSTEESSGGTFTISNLGMFGIDLFAPIINPPESAILGVGRITKKPIVINDGITIRSMMTLTIVFDHRIMDGVIAANFLKTVKESLEEPSNLFQNNP